ELKRALVGQVVGEAPPLRVIQSLVNTLWGYDGFVAVSLLPSGLYLIEFSTQSLCDWVYSRLWHVHNQPLLLRRWKEDLEPVVIEPVEVPVWVTLKKVPPPLCNHLGVGHLASQIGRTLSKFRRVGTTVKVCVLLNPDDARPSSIVVQGESKSHVVDIEYPEFRTCEKRKFEDARKSKQVYKQVPIGTSSKEMEPPIGKERLYGDKQNGSPNVEGDEVQDEIVSSEPQINKDEMPKEDNNQDRQGDSPSGTVCSSESEEVERSGKNGKPLQGDLEDDTSGLGDMEGLPRALSPEFFPPLRRGGRRDQIVLLLVKGLKPVYVGIVYGASK
ncbi:hypothetical protein LINPERPRIM_LOCUS2313, partial [Linum perenne]